MRGKLIKQISEMMRINYRDVEDFLHDIRNIPHESRVEILECILREIEEREGGNKTSSSRKRVKAKVISIDDYVK